MSAMRSHGLLGDSAQTSFVPSRHDDSTASMSERSTTSVSMPHGPKIFVSIRNVPP
jgi:hypothetical protein